MTAAGCIACWARWRIYARSNLGPIALASDMDATSSILGLPGCDAGSYVSSTLGSRTDGAARAFGRVTEGLPGRSRTEGGSLTGDRVCGEPSLSRWSALLDERPWQGRLSV
jgi:hypothetical protein